MSFAIDVDILLYASDAGCAEHAKARVFIERCAAGSEVICLAWPTLMGYLRMATHPAIFAHPLSHEDAARNVDALLALPQVRAIGEDEGYWPLYRRLAAELPVRGNLVPDAHLAALLRQHGIKTIYTRDRDFHKFRGLDVRDPIE
ncbi:MAG: ribonuclease VapC48 [Pseudomonadota bacterium]|nr:PIN domain-containing protein [Rubrivivax sp.]NLZ42261.1 PIN domain-containing protein [Comamonadaceae bacterium]